MVARDAEPDVRDQEGDCAGVFKFDSGLVAYCVHEVVPEPVRWSGGRLREEEEDESLFLLRPMSGRKVGGIMAVPALAAAPAI